MALIYGVNFTHNPSTVPMMCTSDKCKHVSAWVLLCPTFETPNAYYCLQHLFVAARNIHGEEHCRSVWL